MPYLNHPPLLKFIRSIPVAEHSVEVDAAFWLPFCTVAGRLSEHHALFAGQARIRISRQWLHAATDMAPMTRCLAILLWGYPAGARGDLHTGWLEKLPEIAATAYVPDLAWVDYYGRLNAVGGLGISTSSKLACFFGQSFAGNPALMLDQRIIRVIGGGRWTELEGLKHLSYSNAHVHYPEYLGRISAIARVGTVSAEQIEFFLFALGEAF